MPQKRGDIFEKAQRLGHKPIVENELVQEELKDFDTKETDPDEIPISECSILIDDLEDYGERPEYLLSIDGSPQEVATNDDYPSNRIGFIQIAAVLTHLNLIDEQKKERFVDPAKIEDLDESALQDLVLPSSNYTIGDAETVQESWRLKVYESFCNREIEGQSLLDVFLRVIQSNERGIGSKTVDVYRCPNPDCPTSGTKPHIHSHATDLGQCDECGATVYPTDALRTHERVNANQSNETAISAVMNVLEHLTMCAYLGYLSEVSPERLSRTGFVMDGPLAIFDTPAWLHEPILDTINEIYESQRSEGYTPPIICGIEKSGSFRDHAENIEEKMEPGSVLGMDNDYIYNYVMSGTTDLEYGSKTYYGRKFIYKSASERVFVLTLPEIPESGPSHAPDSYPLMRSTLDTLRSVETALYDDATIPVTLAHQRASIPLKTGSRVLELFSKESVEKSEE
jgi:hypothetical protein